MTAADYDALLAHCRTRQPQILETIRQLVVQETPSDDKERLDLFAGDLAGRFRAVGAAVEVLLNPTRGNHLLVRWTSPGTDWATRQALVLCHYDTVWPVGSLTTHPFRVEEGRAYGPGIFDMQASLALCEHALEAISALHILLPRPLTIVITSDEEVGSQTSRPLIEAEAQRSAYALVLESPLPGGVLKTARKGVGTFTLEVTGRAAHAGVEPERGINAVHELAHQILHLQSLGDPQRGTTVSVGVVQGGVKPNVIPARARAEVDVRAWTQAEMERVTAAMQALEPVIPGAQITVTGGSNRPPLEREMTAALFVRVREIGRRLGLDLQEGSTGGGSDASWTAALGIPTLDGLGVPGHGAHADHEHILVDEIAGRTALLAAILSEL